MGCGVEWSGGAEEGHPLARIPSAPVARLGIGSAKVLDLVAGVRTGTLGAWPRCRPGPRALLSAAIRSGPAFHPRSRAGGPRSRGGYSHSMVAGGLSVTSYSTRVTLPESSRVIRSEMRRRTSVGTASEVAVIASMDSTIRTETASP